MPEPLEYERQLPSRTLALTGPVRVMVFGILGMVAGAGACCTLWLILGGWGPPWPLFFVGLGLVLGVIASFAKRQ